MLKQLITILGMSALTASSYATVVTTTTSANDLVSALIGSGITVSNASFIGSSTSAGTYTGSTVESQGSSNLEKGIVLSSGNAAFLNNSSNTSDNITGQANSGSDADLQSLLSSSYTIQDYSSLTFDFEAEGEAGSSVTCSFWYVFGSDEYNEWVGSSYNDVFGFFLDGVNVATIPGTTTPVSINNVNGGSYSSYFTSNDPSDGGATLATEMDGMIKPLYTEFTVMAGQKHTMKIAIGDAGDQAYDSWVLLGGKTFTNHAAVPEPGSASLLIIGLATLMGYGFRKNRN